MLMCETYQTTTGQIASDEMRSDRLRVVLIPEKNNHKVRRTY